MKKLIALLLALATMLALCACGKTPATPDETNAPTAAGTEAAPATEAPTEAAKEIEYYEELTTLPTMDTLSTASYSGKSTSSTNGETTKIVYKYSLADDTTVDTYITGIQDYGFSVEAGTEADYDLIENSYVVAHITLDGLKAELSIVPENLREMPSSAAKPLVFGQKITTDEYEFTLNNVELTYELKPQNTSSWYTSYPADSGKVYIHLDGTLYNASKRDICIRDLPVAKADFDNGYTYEGFALIDDGDNGFDYVSSYVACTPLETCHYHCLIECPEAIDNSDAPLFVTITLADGITYRYDIR